MELLKYSLGVISEDSGEEGVKNEDVKPRFLEW